MTIPSVFAEMTGVRPRAGAWIETNGMIVWFYPDVEFALARGRGLKLF
jgi:hypothetical protein